MSRVIAQVALPRLEALRLELLRLRHQHVEWLANYLEWEELQRRGEELGKELAYARAQVRELRREMAAVERRISFWVRLAAPSKEAA